MKEFGDIVAAIIGVAILSVIVSQRAQTVSVVQAASNAFSNILGVVVAPITKG